MKISLNFLDVSKPSEDYGRYAVLVDAGIGEKEIITADYYHPPCAYCEGWFDSKEYDANPVQVVAWAKLPKALKG